MNAHYGTRIAKGVASIAPGLNAGLERGTILLVRLTWKEARAFGGAFIERLIRDVAGVAHLDNRHDFVRDSSGYWGRCSAEARDSSSSSDGIPNDMRSLGVSDKDDLLIGAGSNLLLDESDGGRRPTSGAASIPKEGSGVVDRSGGNGLLASALDLSYYCANMACTRGFVGPAGSDDVHGGARSRRGRNGDRNSDME